MARIVLYQTVRTFTLNILVRDNYPILNFEANFTILALQINDMHTIKSSYFCILNIPDAILAKNPDY